MFCLSGLVYCLIIIASLLVTLHTQASWGNRTATALYSRVVAGQPSRYHLCLRSPIIRDSHNQHHKAAPWSHSRKPQSTPQIFVRIIVHNFLICSMYFWKVQIQVIGNNMEWYCSTQKGNLHQLCDNIGQPHYYFSVTGHKRALEN